MDRAKTYVPKVAPNLATQQATARMLGLKTVGEQASAVRTLNRYQVNEPIIVTSFQSHWWFHENLTSPSSSAGRLAIPNGTSSFTSILRGQRMATKGRIIGGFLEINTDWTVGQIWLALMIDDVQVYDYDDSCVIDGSDNLHAASFFVPYEIAYGFGEGEEIRATFVTSSDFPNGTIEARGSFLVAYD